MTTGAECQAGPSRKLPHYCSISILIKSRKKKSKWERRAGTIAAVSFVTHNKQLAWKGARVLDYLYDIRKVPLNRLANKIRKLGGIEKIVKIAAEKDPRRKGESEAAVEKEKPSRQRTKNRLGRLGKLKAETPDPPQDSSEDTEIVISISPELRKKLDAMKTGRYVKLICARSDKSGWVDVMLEVHEVRLLKR